MPDDKLIVTRSNLATLGPIKLDLPQDDEVIGDQVKDEEAGKWYQTKKAVQNDPHLVWIIQINTIH